VLSAHRSERLIAQPVCTRKGSRSLPLVVFSLLFSTPVGAAVTPAKALTQYGSEKWGLEQGLPHTTVPAILQTRDGFLWFGTELGLVRFDGLQFLVFDRTNTPELKSNLVEALAEDKEGTLWIGTNGGGLTRYLNGKFQAVPESFGASSTVQALYVDRHGSLWVGTEGGGIAEYHAGVFRRYTTRDGLSDNSIFAFAEDRNGAFWIGTHNGLDRFVDGKFSVYRTGEGLPNNYVHCLYPDRGGGVWVGTNGGGITLFNDQKFERISQQESLRGKAISAIFQDANGTLWVGDFSAGLTRIANGIASSYTAKNGLASDEVWTVYGDRSGALWIGTGGGGVQRLTDGKFTTWSTAEGLSDDVTLAVLQDHAGAVWIGTENGGLNRFQDGKFQAITTRNGLSDNLVFSLCEDFHGGLWVGTRKGLNHITSGKIKEYTTRDGLPNDSVLALYTARDGSIWIGTRGGLSKLSHGTFTNFTTEQGLSSNHVTSIQEDANGDLWVGTDGGLNRLHEGKFAVYGPGSGLSNTAVMSLYPDSQGTLWIGTNGGGLSRFRNGRFTTYTMREGLPDDGVFSILEDARGNLWASCNKGVFRVSKRELNEFAEGRVRSVTPVVYGIADGMKSAECNGGFQPAAWKSVDGKLWFPTMKGVTRIDLNQPSKTEAPVPVFIDQANLNGTVTRPIQGIRVDVGRGDLEFVYTAIEFHQPRKLHFRYRLEPFDRGWIEAGSRRTAYYTNIPPGHYRFMVTARNADGIWTPVATSFDFVLEPHVYQTIWFEDFTALFLLGLLATAHLLRVRQHDRREKLLSQAVAERTKELRREIQEHERTQEQLMQAKHAAENASRAKSEFLANMSHEIRTPMHGVLGMTELALGTELTSEQFEYVNFARGSAQSLLSIINDILDFSKIEAGKLELDPIDFNLLQLLDECAKSLSIKAHEKGLELICAVDPEVPEFLVGDPLRLRQVLFNLAGNAIKFTLKGEVVTQVSLEHRNEPGIWLGFNVKDTGIGIAGDKQKSIFDGFSQADNSTTRKFGGTGLGLRISSRLVQLMGGEIFVRSEIGAGSEFQFSLRFEAPRQVRTKEAPPEELVGKTILVVDDNATSRRSLAAALARWGMKVELAGSANEALSLFLLAQERNAPFSVILIDCNMPDMDGFALAERLGKARQAASATMIMLCSGGQSGDITQCQRLRLTSLMKPISMQDLRHALIRALSSVPTPMTSSRGGRPVQASRVTSPLRILLAEDNPVNRKIAVRMLEKRGHNVEVVTTGAEALARLEQDSFDLLLTDIHMPQMDGFETTAAIRAREQGTGEHLPIIAMTALAMKGDEERCLAAGMDGYISKPMRANELFETVERFTPVPVS